MHRRIMANKERLAELEDSIEAKKEEIKSGGYDEYTLPWAKQKQQLAELVEEYELMLESVVPRFTVCTVLNYVVWMLEH